MSYATARTRRTNGDINKLYPEDRAVHDWYRFVLAFPPHLVRDYLERFDVRPDQCVLDPFCGTGTVLVECKKLGMPSLGVEANPMAHFASRVKTQWNVDADGLMKHARDCAVEACAELEAQGISDVPLFGSDANGRATLRTLPDDLHGLLLKNSISTLPLHKSLVLLDVLAKNRDPRYGDHEHLALAKALVFSVSNLHFGPEVGVGKPKLDAPVISVWLSLVRAMVEDLNTVASAALTPAQAFLCDSRRILDVLQPASVDAVITSPPYPNEKDYTRTTRLESVLLGFIKSKAELQALKRNLVRSNTRGVYKLDTDDMWVEDHSEIQRVAAAIESRRIEMGKTSGFERQYHRVTRLYFGGMARHLAELRTILRPGAQLAYVVGDQASYLRIMIRTGQLLASIAETLGYEVVNIDLFRTRLSTATKEQLREEVVVLRWPG